MVLFVEAPQAPDGVIGYNGDSNGHVYKVVTSHIYRTVNYSALSTQYSTSQTNNIIKF